jgi:hypothetical protein
MIDTAEYRTIGKLNIQLLGKEFGKIQTEEVLITNERADHIRSHHSLDYVFFEKYGKEAVLFPDKIIKDIKHSGTIFMVKELPETNLNVIVRLALETDKKELKNSVMTFFRIRNRNLKKLIKKNKLLYNGE